eukprot:289986_1
MASPSEQSDSVWGRFIPVCANHEEASLNQVFEFRDDVITIGRDPTNHVTLKCPNVSSKHCRLVHDIKHGHQAIFLEDTSTNGTWIDKTKLLKRRLLIDDGMEIILVPGSKKRKRKKLSYFLHLERSERRRNIEEGSLESKYYIVRELGKGAFSTVKLVQDRTTSTKYALKCIDRNAWQRLKHATNRDVSLLDEVEIMKKTNHASIVKVHEYFEEERQVNVILDYCGGGDMLEYIQTHGAYSSAKARSLFKQLIESVDYLHSLRIAHRDLKPDNILLTDDAGDTLKISDFGISREQNLSMCGTIIGTPLYQAPEVHHRRNGAQKYDGMLADYWSLGVILYVMLVAAPPISSSDSSSRIMELSEQHMLPWYDEPVAETAKDMIYKLLQTDPLKRITAKGIYKHAWMMGHDTWNEVPKATHTKMALEAMDSKEEEEHRSNTPCLPSTTPPRNDGNNHNNNMNISISISISSETSTSTGSRKRRAQFDDEMGNELVQPPAKKQKSNPKGIQEEGMTL